MVERKRKRKAFNLFMAHRYKNFSGIFIYQEGEGRGGGGRRAQYAINISRRWMHGFPSFLSGYASGWSCTRCHPPLTLAEFRCTSWPLPETAPTRTPSCLWVQQDRQPCTGGQCIAWSCCKSTMTVLILIFYNVCSEVPGMLLWQFTVFAFYVLCLLYEWVYLETITRRAVSSWTTPQHYGSKMHSWPNQCCLV